MHEDLERILIDRDSIADRVEGLALELARDLEPKAADGPLVLVPVMTGSVVFVADLMRHLPIRFRIEPVRARSYVGATTTSNQPISVDMFDEKVLRDAHVLIVDDVLDSGRTIGFLRELAHTYNARSVTVCVLLRKASAASISCEFVGFDTPDDFVVGYGLDYDGHYRNLPDICVLRSEVVEG